MEQFAEIWGKIYRTGISETVAVVMLEDGIVIKANQHPVVAQYILSSCADVQPS